MITTEKAMRALWCPHVRAIHIDALQMGGAPQPGNLIPQRGASVLVQVSGNKGGANGPTNIPNACMGRLCASWAWHETAWDYSQRTGKAFDPIFEAKKSEPSDRLGGCGIGNSGQPHSRADERAMVENGARRGRADGADADILHDTKDSETA